MEIPYIILFGLLSLFIFYIIIETAVRKGIDSSETGQMIQRMLERQLEEPPPPISDKDIENELEQDFNKKD
ncbi:hypothetical protein ACOJQI_13210 [Bacillus salacetis]|uniref:hypothetical protein n=1 Tax=Bacillus salacetis TaxID=2315464 RepID=UPI003B9EC7BA